VVAVGTTSVRALESAATLGARGSHRLFIHRPYDWQTVDVLMTNFHLPRTTLLMMIDAFVGPAGAPCTTWRSARVPLPEFRRRDVAGSEPELDASRSIRAAATDGAARTGVAHTARGSYRTPCFMPVGTRGAIKYLSAADYERLGAEIVLGNTYHLMLRPGAETSPTSAGWASSPRGAGSPSPTRAGSRCSRSSPKVDDDGVTFKSTYDGSQAPLHPRGRGAHAGAAGADIQMVLDVCPPLPSPPEVVRLARRAHVDVGRAREGGPPAADQALFGIVQGGVDEALRAESAQRTVELDFDGYGIGGLSVGETRHEMLPALAAALAHLPADRPRYLMGVGDPASLVEAVGSASISSTA
jgi:queuine tRNA-ribosyltransferase